MDPLPQVSPDGQFWWDGRTWQPMPTLSPDGSHWWDGRAWQAIPADVAESTAEPAPAPAPQARWSSEDVGPYGTSSDLYIGPSSYRPQAGYGPPSPYRPPAAFDDSILGAQAARREPRNIAGDVVLSGGVLLGFLIVMVAIVGIIQLKVTRGVPAATAAGAVAISAILIMVGIALGLASGLRIFGLSLWAPVRPVFIELAIYGSLTFFGLIIVDIMLLASPAGTFPVYLPWTALIVILYKAWRGKWLAAAALGVVWVLALILQLPSAIG